MDTVHPSKDSELVGWLKKLLPLTTFVTAGTCEGDDLSDKSVLYRFDGDWRETNDPAEPTRSECPLLQDLAAIGHLNAHSVVLIANARYFLAPPPLPNNLTRWPVFDEVIDGLRALSSFHELIVSNEMIIFSPKSIADRLREFLQGHELDWLHAWNRAGDRERQLQETTKALRECEADRSARAAAIQAMREGLQLSEAELRTIEADRASRLDNIQTLHEQLQTSEADRASRLDDIQTLNERLQTIEADRASRLDDIHTLHERLQTIEADRASRLDDIHTLHERLQASEADCTSRLEDIRTLHERLQASEADCAEQVDIVRTLQERLSEWESNRAAVLARKFSRRLSAFRGRTK